MAYDMDTSAVLAGTASIACFCVLISNPIYCIMSKSFSILIDEMCCQIYSSNKSSLLWANSGLIVTYL